MDLGIVPKKSTGLKVSKLLPDHSCDSSNVEEPGYSSVLWPMIWTQKMLQQ